MELKIYPSLKETFGIFFCVYWYFKGHTPFSFWWLVLLTIADIIVATIIAKITRDLVK